MSWKAEVVCDSVGATHGRRLISIIATYPRMIHSEFLTHRDRARSSASSRAIPWKRFKKDNSDQLIPNCMYAMVKSNPFIPEFIGAEQAGMQSGGEIEGRDRLATLADIFAMRDFCLARCDAMAARGVHKSIVNRYVEPWQWITVLYTATEWKNFFRLRVHPAAEKHFNKIAGMMKAAIDASKPRVLRPGELHLPFWDESSDREIFEALVTKKIMPHPEGHDHYRKRISAGRSCRISYLTHEGKRDILQDLKTASSLIERADDVIHAAALEHVATCDEDGNHRSGPFFGFRQFRKEFAQENVPG